MRTAIIYHYTNKRYVGPVTAKMVAGPNWDGDWEKRYWPDVDSSLVEARMIDSWTGTYPVAEELSGPDGMHFTIFVPAGESRENIDKAKHAIRSDRDATGFKVMRCLWD